jgi:hypothetical protein
MYHGSQWRNDVYVTEFNDRETFSLTSLLYHGGYAFTAPTAFVLCCKHLKYTNLCQRRCAQCSVMTATAFMWLHWQEFQFMRHQYNIAFNWTFTRFVELNAKSGSLSGCSTEFHQTFIKSQILFWFIQFWGCVVHSINDRRQHVQPVMFHNMKF